MKENEHQEILTKMLGLDRPYSAEINPAPWAEIYEAIGKLKERASQPPQIIKEYFPSHGTMPLVNNDPNLHYHEWGPCRKNPCIT